MGFIEGFDGAHSGLYIPGSVNGKYYSDLKRYLTYVVPSSCVNDPLPFVDHLKNVMGETSIRGFAQGTGVDHSTYSRLLDEDNGMVPSLLTLTRIVEGAGLSDAGVYRIITDTVTINAETDTHRLVFSDNAPALEGSLAEQFKGYRNARGLSQRTLAEKANVDHSALSRIESKIAGKNSIPAIVTFANLSYALGLNPRQVRGLLRAIIT